MISPYTWYESKNILEAFYQNRNPSSCWGKKPKSLLCVKLNKIMYELIYKWLPSNNNIIKTKFLASTNKNTTTQEYQILCGKPSSIEEKIIWYPLWK